MSGFQDVSSARASNVNFNSNLTTGHAVDQATILASGMSGNYVIETRARIIATAANHHISVNLNGDQTKRFVIGGRNASNGNYYVGVATGSGSVYDQASPQYIPLGTGGRFIIITVYVYNSSNCAVLLINGVPVAWMDIGTTISSVTIGSESCNTDFDGSIVSTSSALSGVFNANNSKSRVQAMRDKGGRGYYVAGGQYVYYSYTDSTWSN